MILGAFKVLFMLTLIARYQGPPVEEVLIIHQAVVSHQLHDLLVSLHIGQLA